MIDVCLCGIAREDCDYHKPTSLPVYASFDDLVNLPAKQFFRAAVARGLVSIGKVTADLADLSLRMTHYNRNQLMYYGVIPYSISNHYEFDTIPIFGFSGPDGYPDPIMEIIIQINRIDVVLLKTNRDWYAN